MFIIFSNLSIFKFAIFNLIVQGFRCQLLSDILAEQKPFDIAKWYLISYFNFL